jgi:hypothetical protein
MSMAIFGFLEAVVTTQTEMAASSMTYGSLIHLLSNGPGRVEVTLWEARAVS